MTGRLTAVTGASGFLGRQIVTVLAAQGSRVRLLARRPQACGPWPDIAPEIIQGELADPGALRRLLEGADAVIHCAGLTSARNRAEFFAVNAQGARDIAEAARRTAPHAHFLFVSSLAAREPQLSAYAASKRAGEEAVREVLGPSACIVRPPAIYGPGDRATLPAFALAARSPLVPQLRPSHGRLAMVHVEDAAAHIVRLADARASGIVALGGHRPEGYAWREIVDALTGVFGRSPPIVPVPSGLVIAAGAMSAAAARLSGKAAVFSPGKAREALHPDWSVSTAELGSLSQPASYDLAAGFRQTARWYREAGWL